jgi:REG-2-like HAD superfamily hydrolase
MLLQAVFIDVGNTLVYEKPSRFEIYAQAARRRGVALAEGEMDGLMRRAHGELPRDLAGAYRYTDRWFEAYIERIFHGYLDLPRAELEPLSEELFGQFARPETFALYPGAPELLDGLRARGLKLAIVSNWSSRLPGLLESLDLARRVDTVLCSAIERCEKPDTAIFAAALARLGVAPDRALHAGDHPEKDVFAARRAGLRAVLVDHAGAHADGRLAPRVRDLWELAALIEGLA